MERRGGVTAQVFFSDEARMAFMKEFPGGRRRWDTRIGTSIQLNQWSR